MKPPADRNPARNRLAWSLAVVAVIVVGFESRRIPGLFPGFLGKYPGDALWAAMVYLALGWIRPASPIQRVAAWAAAISAAVEFSQRYHAPWIDGIRRTTLGHLVLGSTFSEKDLAAYAVGIALCMAGDGIAVAWASRTRGRSV